MARKYQMVYQDGGNGWRLGDVVDGEVRADGRLVVQDEDGEAEGVSRNGDGLFECAHGSGVLWVPLP